MHKKDGSASGKLLRRFVDFFDLFFLSW